MSQLEASPASIAAEPSAPSVSISEIARKVIASPAFYPGVALGFGLMVLFWPMLRTLPDSWFSKDGYYSHGILVPVIAGYIVYRRWPQIKDIPVKPSLWALIPIGLLLVLLRPAHTANIMVILSVGFVAMMLFGAWFIAGFRWMKALSPAIVYTIFALPVWTMAIDTYTNPLQLLSTKVAFSMLKAAGFDPIMGDTTTIYLNKYVLDVAVPCSGLKLVLALTAFTVFFILIARLRLLSNLAMAALVLPLCLFINGLRIALIGIVGDTMGIAAASQFHDYSGYITLLLCFFMLFKIARILGWKD